MRGVGKGIAFAGVCLDAAWVTTKSEEIPIALWLVIVVWAWTGDWGQK